MPLTCTVEGGGHQRVKGINLVLSSTVEPESVELEIDEFLLSTEHAVTSIVNTITNTVNIKGRGVVDASGLAAGQESKEAIEVIELTSSIKAPLLTDFFPSMPKTITCATLPVCSELNESSRARNAWIML